jgi:hypothetical protein
MKTLRIVTLIFFSILWIIGISKFEKGYSFLYRWGVIQDEYRFGDLYNLAHLPQFKEKLVKCESELRQEKITSKPIHLYVLGDSFLEPQRIDSSDFIADRYVHVKWGDTLHFKLDPNAVNVVLIESVERHVRQHFEKPPTEYFRPDTATFVAKWEEKKWMKKLDQLFESERTEGQLGLLLVKGNTLGLKLKEIRSSINYWLFDRTETSVKVSNDGNHLVYYLDTDTLNYPYTAGFSTIPDSLIESVVDTINKTRKELLGMGFDHALFSAIPNKSSVVLHDYGTYNRLIERVQSHPSLKTPFVSVIDEYKALGDRAYLRSDSHWTCDGRLIWLNKTNALLNKLTSGESSEVEVLEECKAATSKSALIQAGI